MADCEQQESLLEGERPRAYDPKTWMALGGMYVCLGVVQIILALLWQWWLGAAVGFATVKLGTSLAGLGYTGQLLS